jgi:hypothetical protein
MSPMPSSLVTEMSPHSSTYLPSFRCTLHPPQAQALRDYLDTLRTFVQYTVSSTEGSGWTSGLTFFHVRGELAAVVAVRDHCKKHIPQAVP